MKRLFPIRLVPLALLALLFAGCETVPKPAVPPVSAAAAEQAEQQGEFVLAAREYERLARTVKAPHKQHFQLRAVEALIRGGQTQEARQKLRQVNVAGLEAIYGAHKRVLEARLLSLEGAHERALRLLDETARLQALDPALLAEVERARTQAELALGNPIGAVRSLIRREQYIADRKAVAENQQQLWKILEAQPRTKLAAELDLARDPVLAGWIELTLAAIENAYSTERLADAVGRWKKEHPAHPAGEALLATLTAGLVTARLDRIALLLPLTSNYGLAAQAVRDGFLAVDAAGANPDKPVVRVYDIGADPARAPEFYAQAVRDGAHAVVGPLGREAADQIIRRADIRVPTLLLSHSDETAAGRPLYQFGLPPEQEARQAAERAWLDGHRRAAVLYPEGPWGERMLSAFTARWQRLGGTLLASQVYEENQSDHSEAIKKLLNIHLSEARRELLEKRLAAKIQFESRARQDVDLIFLAADAKRGRLLKPQLNFYHASHVPVYATSHIYSGRSDPVHDVDLDGVLFADMPWMLVTEGRVQELRQSLQRDWPHAGSDLDRLYALGMDSYAILPHLSRIAGDGAAHFDGVTSVLSLDADGRLQRQLLWARFSKGVPRVLGARDEDGRPGPEAAPGG